VSGGVYTSYDSQANQSIGFSLCHIVRSGDG
jgi:hypothetical protein